MGILQVWYKIAPKSIYSSVVYFQWLCKYSKNFLSISSLFVKLDRLNLVSLSPLGSSYRVWHGCLFSQFCCHRANSGVTALSDLSSTAAHPAWESSGWLWSKKWGGCTWLSTCGGLFEEPGAWGAGSALGVMADPLLPDVFFPVTWR